MESLIKIFFSIIIGATIGAKFYYIIEHLNYYIKYPLAIFKFREIGNGSYGAFIGGFLFLIIYCNKKKLNKWKYLDAFAPSIGLVIFLCRVGCFLNWCCYGTNSNLPWAINAGDFPRHPTQIYLAINGLTLFLIFSKLKFKQRYSGWLFLLFVVYYNISRFFIEFIRDSERHLINLTGPQLTGFLLFLFAYLYFIHKGKQNEKVHLLNIQNKN